MKIRVGIHETENGILTEWSQKYISILETNEIDFEVLSIDDVEFWTKLKKCSHFIYHWGGTSDAHIKAHAILPVIEFELGIPCFPEWKLSWHYDDKIKGYYLLKAHNFPAIDANIFYTKFQAINWIKEHANFPLVFKLARGAGSQDVTLVQDKHRALKIVNRMFGSGVISGKIPGNDIYLKDFSINLFLKKIGRVIYRYLKGVDVNKSYQKQKNYVLFQKYLPGNKNDIRITVINDKAFGFIRYNRPGDFRASGSGNINYDTSLIDLRCVAIAHEISKELKFSSMSYDFLIDESNEPKIAEISYTYKDIAVYNCHGYWDCNLKWQDGHYWPEHLQLIEFLGLPNLVCPQFELL